MIEHLIKKSYDYAQGRKYAKEFFLIEQVNLQNNMFPFNNEKAKQKQWNSRGIINKKKSKLDDFGNLLLSHPSYFVTFEANGEGFVD